MDGLDPFAFTVRTIPERLASVGDPWAGFAKKPGRIDTLLDWWRRDLDNGLGELPFPPEFPKMPGSRRACSRRGRRTRRRTDPASSHSGGEDATAHPIVHPTVRTPGERSFVSDLRFVLTRGASVSVDDDRPPAVGESHTKRKRTHEQAHDRTHASDRPEHRRGRRPRCHSRRRSLGRDHDRPRPPRNVIVLISDGGGYNQFDAARLYENGTSYQQVEVAPNSGTATKIPGTKSEVYDDFPVQIAQSHYSAGGRAAYTPEQAWGDFSWVASGATDSAAAGTALGTGVKTTNGTLGFAPDGTRLVTVGEQAMEVGKKVGLVTSVPFNHATPAGFIAHNKSRNDYHGLATEMIDSGVDVLIGGGHPNYTDANTSRASHFGAGSWISQADFARVTQGQTPFSYIESKADFERVADAPERARQALRPRPRRRDVPIQPPRPRQQHGAAVHRRGERRRPLARHVGEGRAERAREG